MINSFRELRVWQQGMDLVEKIYHITRSFPSEERFGLTSQMRRAAVSIPSNIAEGHTRESTKEYLYHISCAQASLAELQTQIEIAARLGFASSEDTQPLLEYCESLSRQLHALRNALNRKNAT